MENIKMADDFSGASMYVDWDKANKAVAYPQKITEVNIQIGDEYATFKDCASLQEFLDKVQEYTKLRKALDVATAALSSISSIDGTNKSPMCLVAAMALIAHNAEIKISEIMKGSK